MKGFLTTTQTAERLGITSGRVRKMILDGIVTAEKVGRDNFITESEVKRLENTVRPSGRPPKTKIEELRKVSKR